MEGRRTNDPSNNYSSICLCRHKAIVLTIVSSILILSFQFKVLSDAAGYWLQTLHDLAHDLDILGRPREWEEVNKKLDTCLPVIREIVHNGKGVYLNNKHNFNDFKVI